MGVFTRDENEALTYDEDAFYYWAGTMLLVVLVPWCTCLIYGIAHPPVPPEYEVGLRPSKKKREERDLRERSCATTRTEAQRQHAETARRSWRHRLRPAVRLQLMAVTALLMCFSHVHKRLQSAKELRSFDPYEILGVERGADEREIKRAYHRMSLVSHPDKNPDNPVAAAEFQKVAKAHAALTNEQARHNYERYGNPDGPTGMKLSVALHPAMMEKGNQLFTLLLFFFVLFVVIPASALYYYFSNKDYAPNGILIETLQIVSMCIDHATRAGDGIPLLASSLEARRLACRCSGIELKDVLEAVAQHRRDERGEPGALEPGTFVEVFDLRGAKELNGKRGPVKSYVRDSGRYEVLLAANEKGKAIKPENLKVLAPSPLICTFEDPPILRSCVLLNAHVHRLHGTMNAGARREIDELLRQSQRICRAMIGISCCSPGDRSKFFECTKGLIMFNRSLVQALDPSASPLLQLPHVCQETLAKCPQLAQMSLRDVVAAPDAFVDKLPELTPEQALDIKCTCRHLPIVELDAKVSVEDEDLIAVNDVGTLLVTLRRTNLEEGEAAGPAHAPYFPVAKYESWWILVWDNQAMRLVIADAINGQGRVAEGKLLFQVPRHGEFSWTVYAFCDAYAGLDAEVSLSFRALKQKQAKREIFIHPADLHIRSFFEELMMGLQPPEDDDSSESDEEPGSKLKDKATPAAAVAVAAQPSNPSGKKPGEEDDDTSSEEEDGGPEGSIYQIVCPMGAHIVGAPEIDEMMPSAPKLGWCPPGRMVRGVDEILVDDGERTMVLLAGSTPERPPGYVTLCRKRPSEIIVAKALGTFREQPLRNVVSTVTPVVMVRQWVKHASAQRIDKTDLFRVNQIESEYVRLKVQGMLQDKLGGEDYALMVKAVSDMDARRDAMAEKIRGYWTDNGGSMWRVTADLHVQGIPKEGDKIKDRIEIQENDGKALARLGPFVLDVAKSDGCCYWAQADCSSRVMVWQPDRRLSSRKLFMW
jgi:hypothetical protein